MAFRTKIDFSSNRQVKQHEQTFTSLSGGTSFGLTFSALTTGPNLNTTAVTETQTFGVSTFSGNSGNTIYTWYDPRMELGASSLSALTPLNTGITQNTGEVYSGTGFITIDGNTSATLYTGVSFDISNIVLYDMGAGIYTGTVVSNEISYFSAATLDFTGRTIWVDSNGITRTERLIVTDNPQVGYVLTCIDSEGMVGWGPASSGGSGGFDVFVTGGTYSSGTAIFKNNTGGTFNVTGFATGGSGFDVFVTGGTYSSGTATFKNNTGGTFTVTGFNVGSGGTSYWSAGTGTNAIVTLNGGNIAFSDYALAEGYGTQAIGIGSHAEGFYTQANGLNSHAQGNFTKAIGDFAHAEGIYTIASSFGTHAEGTGTTASGQYSHAEGQGSIASGDTSHAEGFQTKALANYTHTEGYQSQATGATSHAEGIGSIAGGLISHAEGQTTKALGNVSHAEGSSTIAFGDNSHAEGQQSQAIGDSSHAQGYFTIASAHSSHAEGYQTTASGASSHAEGSQTIASGSSAHAEGENTQAFGNFSHAEGSVTQALGDSAHAEGSGTIASGSFSHAQGYRTTASGNYSHAEGRYSRAFGVSSHAGGGSQVSGFSGGTAIGDCSFAHGDNSLANGDHVIVFGKSISGTTPNTMYVDKLNIFNVGAGPGTVDLGVDANGYVVNQASDIRLKENINTLKNALDKVLKLRGVTYNWLDRDSGGNSLRIGLIAQEVLEIVPELVTENGEYLGVQYKDIPALLIEAIKELNDKLSISNYTPTSSNDEYGKIGDITKNDDYLYIKTNNGWKRTNLESF